MERVAVISDIHGNLTALNAVLAHIRANQISSIVCLGDLVGKGPRSQQAVEICQQRCSAIVRGNWDELVSAETPKNEVMLWYGTQVDGPTKRYLAGLPNSLDLLIEGRRVRLFHAAASGLYERIRESDPPEVHRKMFVGTDFTGTDDEADFVVYGDIHKAFAKPIDGRWLVNVGSVGNPLDAQTSSYVVLEPGRPGEVKFVVERVAYDIEAEIAVARRLGGRYFDEYATELRTGKYCRRVRGEA